MHLTLSTRAVAENGVAAVALPPRDAALLSWLALEGPTPRAHLAALLWPDSDAEAARNALRQRLFQLRKLLGADAVTGTTLLALAAGVTHDLAESDQVLGEGAPVVAGEFAAWLDQQRQRRRARLRQSLAELAQMAEAACDWADALSHARELLALEPLSEEAHRRLMRLHYLAGDRAAALLAFDRCEQVLKDEVGARPSAETLALLTTVEAGAAVPIAAGAALPASVLRPPRLIGRERELAELSQGWQAGQVVALIGEAGLGKTRLLQTFIESQPGVVRAAGRPGDAGVPFATLARLLRAVLLLGEAATDALVVSSRGEIARVLPEFGDGGLRPAGEGQRLVLQRALRGLLDSQPRLTGLVVDDLHFADEASLEMLGTLIDAGDGEAAAAEQPGLRWALAYRPADGASPVRALHDGLVEQTRLAPLRLAPLDEVALAMLVDSLGLPGVDGAALAPGLRQRTGGNPLFVLEILKQAWVERTLSRLAGARSLPRPVSVGRLIERRVAQLSPGALALARVASIANVDFSIGLAEQVLGASAMQFADALNELEAAQVLRGTQFAHDLVFEAVHNSVPQAIARHTHAQVAGWLEQREGEPARIAAHWEAAGEGLRALPWLEQAALAARRALRAKDFIAFLERKCAIEAAVGQPAQAFETLRRAADEYMNVNSELDTALAYCDRLDGLAAMPRQALDARLQRANLLRLHVDIPAATAVVQAVLPDAVRLGDAAVLMRCRLELGSCLMAAHRPAEALPHLEHCVGWVAEHGDDELRSELHGSLGVAFDNLGRLDEALPHHVRAFELAHASGNLSNATVVCANQACNRIDAGDLVAADQLLQRGQRIMLMYDEYGSNTGSLQVLRALCLCHLGYYGQALTQAELALQAVCKYQSGHEPNARLRIAQCWWHLGQWARLRQALDAILVDDTLNLAARTVHARLSWACARAGVGDATRAREALVSVLSMIESGERPDLSLPLRIDLASDMTPAAALAELLAVREQALRVGHLGTMLATHVRAAEAACEIDVPLARREALAAMALAESHQTTVLLPAEQWLHAARALQAAGDAVQARRVLAQGHAWLMSTAQDAVPPAYRDGFFERNPVNRSLRALAAQMDRAG
jgi:DNA-binding SARP family transcriptional activator